MWDDTRSDSTVGAVPLCAKGAEFAVQQFFPHPNGQGLQC